MDDPDNPGWRRSLRLDARVALVCRAGHALAHIEATSSDLPHLQIHPASDSPRVRPAVQLDQGALSFRCPTCGDAGRVGQRYLVRLFAAMLTHGPAQLRLTPGRASINRAIDRIVPTNEPPALWAVRYARSGRPPTQMPSASEIAAAAGLPPGSMIIAETARQTGAELDTQAGGANPRTPHLSSALDLILSNPGGGASS